jgi:hypothetical protein
MALTGSATFLSSSPWISLWGREEKNPAGAGDRVRLAVIGTGSRGIELINNLIPVLKDINLEISAIRFISTLRWNFAGITGSIRCHTQISGISLKKKSMTV